MCNKKSPVKPIISPLEEESQEDFVKRAIVTLRKDSHPGIHVVHSGLTTAFKMAFGIELKECVDSLVEKGALRLKPCTGGVIISLSGDHQDDKRINNGTSESRTQHTKRFAIEEMINPENGQADLIGALRYIVEKLNQETDIEKGGLYHILRGSMRARVLRLGISITYAPEISQLMQQLGLARHQGKSRTMVWEVVDVTFFEEFVTGTHIRSSIKRMKERNTLMSKNRRHEGVVKGAIPDHALVGDDDISQVLENLAIAVDEVETLRRRVVDFQVEIANLTKELAKKPKGAAARDVAYELMKRIKKSQ